MLNFIPSSTKKRKSQKLEDDDDEDEIQFAEVDNTNKSLDSGKGLLSHRRQTALRNTKPPMTAIEKSWWIFPGCGHSSFVIQI